jgi:hypothetical protein
MVMGGSASPSGWHLAATTAEGLAESALGFANRRDQHGLRRAHLLG